MKLADYHMLQMAFDCMLFDHVSDHSVCRFIPERIEDTNLEEVKGAPSIDKFFKAEFELANLSNSQFFKVCCGDQDHCSKISSDTVGVLNFLIKEIHS